MADDKRLALVAGAGPGLGEALLGRFDQGGYRAVGLTRSKRVTGDNITLKQVDLTDPHSVANVVDDLIGQYGSPAIVVHNPASLVIGPFAETSLESFETVWRNMALSAVILAQAVFEPMVDGGGGAFIVSGATASLRGGAKFAAFSSAKFALRALTQSLAREYQPAGIHVVHVILDGIINTEASRDLHGLDSSRMMEPADIAEAYWTLAHQPQSTWTHEMDLRPMGEGF